MPSGKKATSESLEPRQLLSVSFSSSTGLIAVSGTAVGDQVLFTRSGSNIKLVEAKANYSYAASAVKGIKVTLGSGADSVSVDKAITVPASLTAGSGPDTLVGGGGHNTFYFGTAAATGNTTVQYVIGSGSEGAALDFSAVPAADSVTVDLNSDAQLATFGTKSVKTLLANQAALFTVVTGGLGDDYFTANAGADSLVGGSGNTTLVAGSGADTLVGSGSATDYIFHEQTNAVKYTLSQARSGHNQLDFSALSASDSLTVNLNYDVLATYNNVTVRDAKAGQYINFNWVDDGPGNDVISANKTGNTIVGGNGDDFYYGGAGADFVQLGGGTDYFSGNGGGDIVIGGAGYDVVYATDPTSDPLWFPASLTAAPPKTLPPGIQVYGGSGDISIVGGAGNDTLVGGSGNCTIHGMGGDDYIMGGTKNSLLFGDSGNDSIVGGQGDNIISGGAGINNIQGGTVGGTSTFIDKNLPDNVDTAAYGAVIDTDSITAAAIATAQGTAPALYPEVGAAGTGDVVIGGSALTTIIGGAGDETLKGGDGQSTLVAGSGFDLLIAGYGNDVMQGGAGEDTLCAGNGADEMTGGTGNAVFLNLNGYADTVTGGSGFNVAQADPTGLTTFSNIQIIFTPNKTTVTAPVGAVGPTSNLPEIATPASPPAATLTSGVLHVGSSSFAGGQIYNVSQAGGMVTVWQPTSVQQFAASSIKSVSILGGPGADDFNLTSLTIPVSVNAGNGNNTIIGGSANDTLTSGSGDDYIYGGTANNVISGGGGNNVLFGGPGNDSITGGSGSDWIYPGGNVATHANDTESDTIIGGSGTEKVGLNATSDPETIRLDKGTITDTKTGAVTKIKNVRNIWAGSGNDLMVGGTAGGILMAAGSGNDTVYGISASDVLYGGAGDCSMYLDGNNGFLDLAGNHASTPGNIDFYNQGKTILSPLIDSTDLFVPLAHPST